MLDLSIEQQIEQASARADAARIASEKAEEQAKIARQGCETVRYEAELSKRQAEVARAIATAKLVESEVVRAEIRLSRAERNIERAKDKVNAANRALERAQNAIDLSKRARLSETQLNHSDSIESAENARITKIENDSLARAADAASAESIAASNDVKIEQAELNAAVAELEAAKAKFCFAESVAKFGQLHLEAAKKVSRNGNLLSKSTVSNGIGSHRPSGGETSKPLAPSTHATPVIPFIKNGKLEEEIVTPISSQESPVTPSTDSVRTDANNVEKDRVPSVAAPSRRVELQKSSESSADKSQGKSSIVPNGSTKPVTSVNNAINGLKTATPVITAPSVILTKPGPSSIPAPTISRPAVASNPPKAVAPVKKPVRRSHAVPIVDPKDIEKPKTSHAIHVVGPEDVPKAKPMPKENVEIVTQVAPAVITPKPNVVKEKVATPTPSPSPTVTDPTFIVRNGDTNQGKNNNNRKGGKGPQPAKIRYCAVCGVQEQPKVPKKGFYRGPNGNRTLCLPCNLKWLMERKAENIAKEEEEKELRPTSNLNAAAAAFTPGMPIVPKKPVGEVPVVTPVGNISSNASAVKPNNEKKTVPVRVIPKTLVVPHPASRKHSHQDHRQNLHSKPNPPVPTRDSGPPSGNMNGQNSFSGKPIMNRARGAGRVGSPFDPQVPSRNGPSRQNNPGSNPFESQGMSNGSRRRGVSMTPQSTFSRGERMPLDPMAANRRPTRGGNVPGDVGSGGVGNGAFDGYYKGYDSRRNPIGTGYPTRNQNVFAKQESNTYYDEGYASSNGDYRPGGYSESTWDNDGRY